MADETSLLTRKAGEVSCASMAEGARGHPIDVAEAATSPLRRAPRATSPALRVRSVDVVTFGCRLNAHESDKIAAQAAADGVTDAVVFNTCAVTTEAVRQARQQIRKARRERPGARLVVTGCAAQIDPAAFAAMPEVDLVLGNADKAAPGALLKSGMQVGDIFAARPPLTSPLPASGERATGSARSRREGPAAAALSVALSPTEELGRGEVRGRARAYVEVQNGCDHRCTFCIIPFGRGNARSVVPERVVDEVRDLARAGYAEVVLTGVDLTSWGAELAGAPQLGDLVGRILDEVLELPRLRLSSIDAAEIDRRAAGAAGERGTACPHLHLSLQSGDDLHPEAHEAPPFVDRRAGADRTGVPRAAGDHRGPADFIAGFPTETDAAFENTGRVRGRRRTSPTCTPPVQPAAGHAGRAHAAGRHGCREGPRRAVARRRRRSARPPPGPAVLAAPPRRSSSSPAAPAPPTSPRSHSSGSAPVGAAIVPTRLTGHDGRRAIGALA